MNTKYKMHTDGFDAGPSRMVALGNFSRGRLWLHASKNNTWSCSAAVKTEEAPLLFIIYCNII